MSPPVRLYSCSLTSYEEYQCYPEVSETEANESACVPDLATFSEITRSEPPFAHASGVRLFAECPVISSDRFPSTYTSPVLAEFRLEDPRQTCMMQELRTLLEGMGFDDAHQRLHPNSYGMATVFDDDWTPDTVLSRLASSGVPAFQQSAIGFFMYGRPLSERQMNQIFSGREALRDQLRESGIIATETRGGETYYRLNNISLESHLLPNGETMYLFTDLPTEYRGHRAGEATAQLSGTSYILLQRLEQDFENGMSERGVIADLGSGTGIQAIALLMMHPEIEEAISLEIDSHSMNLHRLNAMLNGVSDRTSVVDNSDPQAMTRALAGRQLSLAVSNPPFNTVPSELASRFTNFGDGGEHGIDVTTLFIQQVLPHLEAGGEMILYSQLAEAEDGQLFLQNHLETTTSGLNVMYENLSLDRLDYDRDTYAAILHQYLNSHGEGGAIPSENRIRDALRASSVAALHPYIVRLLATGDTLPNAYSESAVSLPGLENFYHRRIELLRIDPPSLRRGGIHIEEIEHRGGVYLQLHRVPDTVRFRRLLEERGLSPDRNRER